MVQKQPEQEQEQEQTFKIRNVPTVISMRDLLVILGAVMTVASGYFTFESRLTILLHDHENLTETATSARQKTQEIEQKISEIKFEMQGIKREMEFLHKERK